MDAGEAVTVPEGIETAHQVVALQEESCAVIKDNSITIEGRNNIGVSKEVVNHVTTVVEKKKNDEPAIDGVEKLEGSCEKVTEKDGADSNIVAKGEDAKRVPNSITTAVEENVITSTDVVHKLEGNSKEVEGGDKNVKTLTDVVDKLEGISKEVDGVNGKNINVDPTEEEAKDDNSVEEADKVEDMEQDEVDDMDGDEIEKFKEVEEFETDDRLEEGKNEENTIETKDKGETVSGDVNKEDVNVSSGKKVEEKNVIQVEKNKASVVAAGRKIEKKVGGNRRNKNVNKGSKTGNKPTPKTNPKTPESGKKRKVSDKPSPKTEDDQEPSSLKRTSSIKNDKAGFDAGLSNKENGYKEKGDSQDGLDPLVKSMNTKSEPGSSLRKKGSSLRKKGKRGKKRMNEAQIRTELSANKNVSKEKEIPEATPGSSQKKKISKDKYDKKPGSSSKKESMRRADCMGMIFMCSSKTKKDCYRYNVLGLPAAKKDMVQKIYKGMRLFLFDFDLRVMYGIYKAAGPGGFNIEPKAFKSAFPSQVRFKIQYDCEPLGEEKFKKVIKDNYYSKNKFNGQLNSEQVKNLCKLFQATSRKSNSDFARNREPERNRVRGDQDRRVRSQRPAEERRQPARVSPNHHQHGYDERSAVYDEREAYMWAPVAQYPPPPLHHQSPTLLAPSSLEMDMYRRNRVIEDYGRNRVIEDYGRYRRSDLEEIDRRESYLPYNREEVFPPIYHHALPQYYSVVNEPRERSPPTYEAEYRRGGGGWYRGGGGAEVPSIEYHHRPYEYGHHRGSYRL